MCVKDHAIYVFLLQITNSRNYDTFLSVLTIVPTISLKKKNKKKLPSAWTITN